MESKPLQFEPSSFEKLFLFFKEHGKKVMNFISILVAILIMLYMQWEPYPASKKKFNQDSNGLWVGNRWLTGNEICPSEGDCIPVSKPEQEKLVRNLKQYRIRYLYVYVGPFLNDGKLLDRPGPFFEKLRLGLPDTVHCVAWVNSFTLDEDIDSKKWRNGIKKSLQGLRESGFDGIHFNFEDLPSDKTRYLALLKEVRDFLNNDFIISHAVSMSVYETLSREFMPEILYQEKWFHTAMQYTDQTVLLAMGTMLPFEKFYIAHVKEGTRMLIEYAGKKSGHRILVGVPAADYGKFKNSFEHVENMKNGILGVTSALEDYPVVPPAFEGISLYAYYTSGSFDWTIMRKLWLGK